MDWTTERARVAALSRHRGPDDPQLTKARADLKVARLADYIERTVAAAPPLDQEQCDKLALLLRPKVTTLTGETA